MLDFFNSKMEHSNLGGKGPDEGAETMRFESIGVTGADNKPFDMVITTVGDYKPSDNKDNGFECGQPDAGCTTGHFAQVSVATETSVDLLISFQDSATQVPVTLDKFLFSIHDVDQFSSKMQEKITISGFIDQPIRSLDSEVGIDAAGVITSTKDGTLADDPEEPFRLGNVKVDGKLVDQRKRSVAFVYEGVSSISLTLEVTCDSCGQTGGRTFLFSGDTNLVTCPNRPGA